MKSWKKIFFIVLGVVIAGVAIMLLWVSNGLSEGANVPINGVNMAAVPDGSYTGSYTHGRWTNTLTVQVKDHKIIKIIVDKDVVFALADSSDEIFRRVMEAQDTKVDVISGSTVTSKAYLKAIENALQP